MATLLHLKQQLQKVLWILGAMIGAITLSAGALRNALLAWDPKISFPEEIVLVYGAYFTIVLALTYVPTFMELQSEGQRLRDEEFPAVPPEDPSFADRQGRRQSIDSALELEVGALTKLKTTMAVFAPLASGLVSILLGR